MNPLMITYRKATNADREWLFELKRATMREYVAAVFGWDAAVQRRMFEEKFSPASIRVIQVDGHDAGLLEVEERVDQFFLARIEVWPAHQRKGVGSRVIRTILEEARGKNKRVSLQLLRSNPVRKLYERLGFSVCGETASHYRMKKEPDQSPGLNQRENAGA
jgi:GNAT superfamily N-acetyltransferase